MLLARGLVEYVGLFGYLGRNADIRNLGVDGGIIRGNRKVGCLAGYNEGSNK